MAVLTEIKKGQVGTGLLIENDGFVSLDLPENKILKESFEAGKLMPQDLPRPFVVNAVFQKYGIENANGRIYPEAVLKREVERYQNAINERRAYGEANHPEESAINLDRIALNIIELHWIGHTLVGKMEIPVSEGYRTNGGLYCCADYLAHWILSGLKIGVSSRGLGTVKQQLGKLIVADDYEIVCWDAVTQPSTPSAWITLTDNELEPYLESKEKKNNIIKEDKFSEFDKWLLKD